MHHMRRLWVMLLLCAALLLANIIVVMNGWGPLVYEWRAPTSSRC